MDANREPLVGQEIPGVGTYAGAGLYIAPKPNQQVQIVHTTSYGSTGNDYNAQSQVQQWLSQGYRVLNTDIKIVSYNLDNGGMSAPPVTQTHMSFILVKD